MNFKNQGNTNNISNIHLLKRYIFIYFQAFLIVFNYTFNYILMSRKKRSNDNFHNFNSSDINLYTNDEDAADADVSYNGMISINRYPSFESLEFPDDGLEQEYSFESQMLSQPHGQLNEYVHSAGNLDDLEQLIFGNETG
jgi:hypothetical protein